MTLQGFPEPTARETFEAFRAKMVEGDRIDLWREDRAKARRTRLGSYTSIDLIDIHKLFGAGDYQLRLFRQSAFPQGGLVLAEVCKITLDKESP